MAANMGFERVVQTFLGTLEDQQLSDEHYDAIVTIASQRLHAVLTAALETLRSGEAEADNDSVVETADGDEEYGAKHRGDRLRHFRAAIERRLDELIASERPDYHAPAAVSAEEEREPQAAPRPGSQPGLHISSRLAAANAEGFTTVEIAIADHLRQHHEPRELFIAFDQLGDGACLRLIDW